MSANFDYAAGVGDFIDSWGDSVTEPYKNVVPVLADSRFNEGTIAGGVYHVTTRLTYEGGTTFAPPQSQPGEGGLTYVGPRAGQVTDAQLQGMQIHGRSRVTYEAIARSAQSVSNYGGADKKKAVQTATKLVADGLMQGTLKKIEALMLHGREGIGQMDSAVNASNTVATVYEGAAGFAVDLALSPQSWSAAMWAAFEGHTFDIFADTAGLPSGTKLNTAANSLLTGGANQTGLVLIAVNPTTPLTNGTAIGRVIRLWSSSGTAGAVGTGVIGGWTPAAAGVNHVCFESGGPANEFVGLGLMAQNTTTLFNINAANYGMWRGNNLAGVGNLRLAQLIRAISATILNFGGQGATIRSVVPTELFAQFANDESTLKRYSSSTGGDAENGFDSIQMYLPHKSRLEILGHALQKDGVVLSYIPDEIVRVGSAELDFVNRAASNGKGRKEQFLVEVQDRPSSEMRLYGQFAPICATPRHLLRMSGVTF